MLPVAATNVQINFFTIQNVMLPVAATNVPFNILFYNIKYNAACCIIEISANVAITVFTKLPVVLS